MRKSLAVLLATVLTAAATLGMAAPAGASHEIVLAWMCDRTGATQTVGVNMCPGAHDYVALVNSKGGVEGHKIRLLEIDHEYKVPPAMEAYERFKKEGAVAIWVYGTPMVYALTSRLMEDRIPGLSPGFGRGDSADGTRYPYVFPVAASYWSQATASVKHAADQLKGLKGKKIAFLYFDNPAGREPIPILEDLAGTEGFQLRTFAVPPPGLEMGAQVLDIAQRYRADFVIAHLFGRSPSVSIREFKRVGYPLSKIISFVWGAGEADIEAAGGFGAAEGYNVVQFFGVGQDFPVHKEIREMYRKEGKEPPKEMASTVYYNRGVATTALMVEAVRNAVRAKKDGKITGEDVRQGFYKIRNFTLDGLAPPLEISEKDHEGGGWVQVWQVKGGKWARLTDWFKAHRDIVDKHIKEAAKK